MAAKFGTSGLRGLVVELTSAEVTRYVQAFLTACPTGSGLYIGRDLRDSSPRIAADVAAAAQALGVDVTDCGAVPTPALALAAMAKGAAAVMVTGSHIPADRNGLKFYTPTGEITKADEAAILRALDAPCGMAARQGQLQKASVGANYVARYVRAFGSDALMGRKVGVWSHSAVGRDLLIETLRGLGAETCEIARSDHFIPVDTEAVSEETRAVLRAAAAEAGLAAIVSTDGDGDRPLLADEFGEVVGGDVLGQITARVLGAEVAVTPVSSNSGIARIVASLRRTKIGSPFVIAEMEAVLAADPAAKVVGYEANGGFLLGFDANRAAGPLPALMTRDSQLPLIATLIASGAEGVAARVAKEPARFTAADRLENVPTERSQALVARLRDDEAARTTFVARFASGEVASVDTTDGLRLTLSSERVLHLRPSGNAPELRFYAEAETAAAAKALMQQGLELLAAELR